MYIGLVTPAPPHSRERQPRHGEPLGRNPAEPGPPGHAQPELRWTGLRPTGGDPRAAERRSRCGVQSPPTGPARRCAACRHRCLRTALRGRRRSCPRPGRPFGNAPTPRRRRAQAGAQGQGTDHRPVRQAHARVRPVAKRPPLRRERRGAPEAGQGPFPLQPTQRADSHGSPASACCSLATR